MKLNVGDWVVVCDGGKYLVLENQGGKDWLDLRVLDHEDIENPPAREQGTDRPGRQATPAGQHAAVSEIDWHEIGKERFALDLASRLDKWADRKRFARLALIADPATLGVLRKALTKSVRERLVGEIVGNYVHRTTESIEKTVRAAEVKSAGQRV